MNLGVICPSEIAIRRFMPSLQKSKDFSFVGIGIYTKKERYGSEPISDEMFRGSLKKEIEKADVFVNQYGGKIFNGYEEITKSDEIDALYIPLPPALHFKWAKRALENGKHVLIEKPATMSLEETRELVQIAKERSLALHENYMFSFHSQLDSIDDLIVNGELGDVRLYRVSFGFPMRGVNDFRYNRVLGGGALIDAGGYTIKYAARLLGPTAKIRYAQSNFVPRFDVDMYGSAVLSNEEGLVAQIAFGMDNNYKCELEVWGSKGSLFTGRVLTAPDGFSPTVTLKKGNEETIIKLPPDDAFYKSINHFSKCITDTTVRQEQYDIILKQAEMVDEFKRLAGWS